MRVRVFKLIELYSGGLVFLREQFSLKDYVKLKYGWGEYVDVDPFERYKDLGIFDLPEEFLKLLRPIETITTLGEADSGLGWHEYHAE